VILAKALFHEGWAQWTQGRDAEARRAYDEARQIFTDLHDGAGLARCWNNIGLAAHRDHNDADAQAAFEEALRHAAEIGDTTAQAWVLNNWASLLYDKGELPRALELFKKKLALGDARGEGPDGRALAHVNIAEILRWQGDLRGARQHGEAAEELLRGLDARRYAAWVGYQVAEIQRAGDDLAGARKRLQQALGWASDVMTPAESAEIRVSLARTELDAGRAAEAEQYARTAVADLRAAKDTSQRVCAVAVLASALLLRNRIEDAQRELAAAPPRENASFVCRLEADVVAARISAGQERGLAISALQALQERALKSGFLERELEIRLVVAQLGAADAHVLARAALAKGFKQIARRASDLAKGH
jgi:tetratricopeptide (TPR) repeat protein